jgi:hypothetical protein
MLGWFITGAAILTIGGAVAIAADKDQSHETFAVVCIVQKPVTLNGIMRSFDGCQAIPVPSFLVTAPAPQHQASAAELMQAPAIRQVPPQ